MKTNRAIALRKALLAALPRDERGVSAVEFALILPLMVTMYLGLSELTQGISVSRKITLVSRALGDLTSQATGVISNSDMNDIFDAVAAIMAPYPTGPLKVTVTALKTGTNRKSYVAWSETRGGQAKAVGSMFSLRSDQSVPNTQVIMTEVSYDYKPTIGYTITGTVNMFERMFMVARVNTIVRVP